MFWRLLWKLLRSNRGRLAVALVAVISGSAVVSALLTVQLDISRKLTQEFRLLGPNIVISAKDSGQNMKLEGGRLAAGPVGEGTNPSGASLAAMAPFFYTVARVSGTPVIVSGTWLDQLPRLNPTWRIEGAWIAAHDGNGSCLIGRNVAQQFGAAPGGDLALDAEGRHAVLRISGIIDSGTAEDNQIFADLPTAWQLANDPKAITLIQLNVTGSSAAIGAYAGHLEASMPDFNVRPVRAVADAEGNLLNRTRLLIVSMIVLIMALTALCVLATMTALATERRTDVGLMKALGGTITRIVGLFLAELGVLGAVGGAIGCVGGVALAEWIGRRVFGAAIAPRWEIFPLTIALMVVVAMAGALPLQALGKVKPAVILRGE